MSEYRERFQTRKDELEWLYQELYHDASHLSLLEAGMESYDKQRSTALKQLDAKREGVKWYLNKEALGVTMYADLFAGDLKGMKKRVAYLTELGITYLHLMPLLSMPETQNDGGYAVSDFNTVDPRFGSNDDLASLTAELHKRGISICLDFVMNHTSSDHLWARKAKAGDEEYQARYLCYHDRNIPDQYERTVPQVFPTTAPGNFTYCQEMQKWVFTSFYPFQWDLNYRNPVVLNEMIFSLLSLANLGVDVFRIDAVPYIWKQLGTNCRNLPQVHTIIRIVRLVLECVAPSTILKGEVVMEPKELAAYFGTPEKPECHLLYNVSTMVTLWDALASQDARQLNHQSEVLLSLPSHCEFLNYIRCHDDIGWGLDEPYERTIGIDPLVHKVFLYHFYEGDFPGSYAHGELYNYDPVSLDARSCGTSASLCGIEQALNEHDAEKLEKAIARFLLMHATMYSLKGFPMLSSGDEIAQLNDYSYKNDPERALDSRNLHRSQFNWEKAKRRNTQGTIQNKVWDALQKLHQVRKDSICFDEDAKVSTWDSQNPKVFALKREKQGEVVLCVCNFSEGRENVKFSFFTGEYEDMLTGLKVMPGWGFTLEPHQYLFLRYNAQ